MTTAPARPLADLFTPAPTRVMGVVNVTPDSFSDGGRYLDPDAAVRHGLALAAEGAHLVDVGGESTRPGTGRVDLETELFRVVPVVRRLADSGVLVSVDTMRAEVARQVAEAGAVMVNDVSGGLADEAMLPTVAATGLAYVAMHWRGHSDRMQSMTDYVDVVAEVEASLRERARRATQAGVADDRIVLDPGIGFGKTADHNWRLLQAVARFERIGHPVLWGVSRKGFLARLGADDVRPPLEREAATLALTTVLAQAGVWGVRVHTVADNLTAIATVTRLREDA